MPSRLAGTVKSVNFNILGEEAESANIGIKYHFLVITNLMNEIPIEKVGVIKGEKDRGHYVKVHYDSLDTGGYYIYISPTSDFKSGRGGNYWVEKKEDLPKFFLEAEWEVEWIQ
jgi:hypothetical protein